MQFIKLHKFISVYFQHFLDINCLPFHFQIHDDISKRGKNVEIYVHIAIRLTWIGRFSTQVTSDCVQVCLCCHDGGLSSSKFSSVSKDERKEDKSVEPKRFFVNFLHCSNMGLLPSIWLKKNCSNKNFNTHNKFSMSIFDASFYEVSNEM